ncbi:MAG: RAMP superfamily CRISPR-associated protein [Roseiarcus sp.]|jgi:CRISPR/Cas system CSM-associated protein Csm3 (group 7 of RAMP superfamily)
MSHKHKGKPHLESPGPAAANAVAKNDRSAPSSAAEPSNSVPADSGLPSERSTLHLLRVTIEAESPLALGSGDVSIAKRAEKDDDGKPATVDMPETALARDAYGLPTIPGATIQGLLRGLADHGSEVFKRVFGWAESEKGAAATLQVGFARVHDVLDRAVAGFLAGEADAEAIDSDPIFAALRASAPLRRDHAKLNERHVVDGGAKFTRLAVPVGTRFSFEMALWSAPGDAAEDGRYLCRLAGLLAHPAFRIGGGGKRGYGRIKVVKASYARPKLETVADLKALRELRRQVPSEHFASRFTPTSEASGVVIARLRLTPVNPWRIGRGVMPATEKTHGVRDPQGEWTHDASLDLRGRHEPGQSGQPDMISARDALDVATPVREAWIDRRDRRPTWRAPLAEASFVDSPFAIPGSALKGPLVHRALFHWNRTNNRLIDVDAWFALDETARTQKLGEYALRPPELCGLLGSPKERQAKDARAARLIVDDGTVDSVQAIQGLDHNSIDRFTGGVREGFLYAEEVLVGGDISVRIVILPPLDGEDWPHDVRAAFVAALADLCRGRLAIGAKSLGFCTGTVEWSGQGAEAWRESWLASSALRVGEDAA